MHIYSDISCIEFNRTYSQVCVQELQPKSPVLYLPHLAACPQFLFCDGADCHKSGTLVKNSPNGILTVHNLARKLLAGRPVLCFRPLEVPPFTGARKMAGGVGGAGRSAEQS